MYFKKYILKIVVNNKQLEITRSFDLNNLIYTSTEILKDNKINLIVVDEINKLIWRNEKSTHIKRVP